MNSIGRLINLKDTRGVYLKYMLTEYEKNVIEPYIKFSEKRNFKLSILLDHDFHRAKDSVDEEMGKIANLIDSYDLDNLLDEELKSLAVLIEQLSGYMDYIIECCDPDNSFK